MITNNFNLSDTINSLIDNFIGYKIRKYHALKGFSSLKEAISLYKIASFLPDNSTIVEIGSWKGKSTYCLVKGIKTGKIIAIDPFDASGDSDSQIIYNQKKGNTPLIEQFKANMSSLKVD